MRILEQNKPKKYWGRAIIFIYMNAFFASIEQLDFPELRGKPIAITNGYTGTGIITCSYEARYAGVASLQRLKDAIKKCPNLIRRPARPKRYSAVSKNIMSSLNQITPDIEVFSVDEAFLDVTHCQKLYGSPEIIGKKVQQIVYNSSGLLCSVGVSGDKTTAKLAGKEKKPNGFIVVPPWESEDFLARKLVTDLCGVATGIGEFLAELGVKYCKDMKKIPISILGKRFGTPGKRIWYMAQGKGFDDINLTVCAVKSIGHSKIMPPNTRNKNIVLTYIQHMSEKVAFRLRQNNLQSQKFFFKLKSRKKSIKDEFKTELMTNDGYEINQYCRKIFLDKSVGQEFYQVKLIALNPYVSNKQSDMFYKNTKKRDSINKVMDIINLNYGEFKLAPARLVNRSNMPNVISPAWKPYGHRQTIL